MLFVFIVSIGVLCIVCWFLAVYAYGLKVRFEKCAGEVEQLKSSVAKWTSTADSFRKFSDNAHESYLALLDQYEDLRSSMEDTEASLKKEVSRNKSVEVRTGQIVEKIAPFMDTFGHDPRNAHFIGQPIDFVVFNEDDIVFVEVKTGKSRMTPRQNSIKKLVEDGKVRFEVVRFDYE